MKKTTSNDKRRTKLRVTTETIRQLTERQLEAVVGGGSLMRTSQNTCSGQTTE